MDQEFVFFNSMHVNQRHSKSSCFQQYKVPYHNQRKFILSLVGIEPQPLISSDQYLIQFTLYLLQLLQLPYLLHIPWLLNFQELQYFLRLLSYFREMRYAIKPFGQFLVVKISVLICMPLYYSVTFRVIL